ncbi:MAG TPA: hypothetical protein VLD63_08540 [Anaerolineales bacterium]|nr:hypothetical protein [Anaerolineales bacterium]
MTRRPLAAVLQHLEDANLIRLESASEGAASFHHGLIQETAYDSLLRPERRELHLQVAEILEGFLASRGDEFADVLAHHFDEGGDSPKAMRLYGRAGELALRRWANQEAAMLYGRALALAVALRTEDELITDLASKKGRALELAGRYAEALAGYSELTDVGRRFNSWRIELAGLLAGASIRGVPTEVFDLAESSALTERALGLARAHGDTASESRALWTQMRSTYMTDPEKAVELGEASLALARSVGLTEQVAFTLNDLQYGYLGAGRLPDALHALEEARGKWAESDNLPMLADNLVSTAALTLLSGDIDRAVRLAQEGLEIAERIGNLWGQAYARMPMSQAFFLLGDLGAAIVCLRECLELAEPAGFLDPQVTMRSLYGVCLAMVGDVPGGVEEIERAAGLAGKSYRRLVGTTVAASTLAIALAGDLERAERRTKELMQVAGPDGLMLEETSFLAAFAAAEVALLRHDPDQLIDLVGRYEKFLERYHLGAFFYSLQMYRGLALAQKGDAQRAIEELEAVIVAMDASGADLAKWRPYAVLAEVREQQGQLDEARRCHQEAAARLERLASGLPDERLRQLFYAKEDVRRELSAVA